MCLFPVYNPSWRMAFAVLFSFILLAWTLSLGIGLRNTQEKCIISMSSHYPSVSQYCILESTQQKVKPAVCEEIFNLFDEICSFNISFTAFHLPDPFNDSKENCVPLCAGLDVLYLSLMVDSSRLSSISCKKLCTMDPEAVTVLSTVSQLKGFIAELKENQTVETVTNSTLGPLQQSNSTSGAEVNKQVPIEPDIKPSTAGKTPTLNVKTTTKETKVSSTKPGLNATITVTKERTVSSAKPVVTTFTTVRPSSTKSTKKPTTTTTTGQIDSTPKEADTTLKPVSTGKTPTLNVKTTTKGKTPTLNVKTTTTGERMVSSTNKDVKKTEEEPDKTTDSKEGLDNEPEETTEDVGESNPENEMHDDILSNTNKKDETSKLITESERPSSSEINHSNTDEKDETSKLITESERPSSSEIKHSNTDEKDETSNLITESEIPSLLDNKHSNTDEKDETSRQDDTPSSYHFLIYFLAFIVLCVAAYIVFHNKHKIIAFIVEGKQGRRGGRPSTKQYTPLKSKVEDVMPFIEKSTTQSNYIY